MGTNISGLWNQLAAAHESKPVQLRSSVAQNATESNAAGQAAGISSNDFLTLLVTEMKNQDPTAQTDPNEYVNQLVQVNSLEQLISINETLQASLGTATNASAEPKSDINANSERLEHPAAQPTGGGTVAHL